MVLYERMKHVKKRIPLFMFLLVLALVFTVSLAPANAEAASKKKPTLKASKATVYYNNSSKKTVKIVPKGNSYKIKSTSYSVAKKYKSYISVSKKGLVTGKKAGKAYVTCKIKYYYKGKKTKTVSRKFTVTIKKATSTAPVYAKVTGVNILRSSVSREVGQTYSCDYTVSPSNATDKSVAWSSSNTSVATVNSKGVVTCIKAGTATITVKTNDSGYTDSIKVTVTAKTSDDSSSTLIEAKYPVVDSDGNTRIGLQAYTTPSFSVKGGTYVKMYSNTLYSYTGDVYFESSNENVIGIKYANQRTLANGMITNGVRQSAQQVYAVRKGTATITVRKNNVNGEIIGRYTVNVTSDDPFYTWRQKIISEHTTSDMSNLEKLKAIAKWLGSQSIYPSSEKGIVGSDYEYNEPGAWSEIENGTYVTSCYFVGVMYYFCTDMDVYSYVTHLTTQSSHAFLHIETNGGIYHCDLQGGYGEVYTGELSNKNNLCNCYLDSSGNILSTNFTYHSNDDLVSSELTSD